MKMDPLEIFRGEDDYVNWDRYEQQVELIKLTDTERARARWSLQYLRTLLGEDFLKTAFRKGHPLLSWFLNAAPRARLSLIGLAEALKALEGADNFDGLVARLKDPRRAGEALTVLEAAYRFLCAGFEVDFDPSVMLAV